MPICEQILRKAKSLHIDECEAVTVLKKVTTVRITDSEIAEIKQNKEQSLAVRIIHEKRILSARMNDFEVENTLDRVLQTKHYAKPRTFWKSLPYPLPFTKIEKTHDKKLDEITSIQAIEIANRMIQATVNQKITRISGSLNIVSEEFEINNTNGLDCSEKSTYIAGIINADSDYGTIPVSGVGAESSRTLSAFSPESVGNDASEMCVNSINPQNCEAETYSIIFEPYAIGEMLAFVFASNFNLKTYSEKRSCFAGKLGQKVAVPRFSLIDDPHSPEGIGSKPFDDEGTPTRIRYLIESGIFANTYSDSFYAFKENQQTTGNASRMGSPMGRDAQPIPVSLPHNLRVKEGDLTKEKIIQETKKGLLVGRLWYTYAVNPERGDFSCTARSGIRIIENGVITKAGKPVRIVHNLPILLQNISEISNDSKNVLQWSALPCITPSLKVDGIRVNPI
ncbi:MAG: TldD/PmbA family protein [Nitrosotalea sp.]